MNYDTIIVGGGFAGQAAAFQLGRARLRVLLIDSRRPRNRFAKHSHGFLGQDGKAPSAITHTAVAQLATYPTVEIVEGEAAGGALVDKGIRITLADGHEALGKRLILATGVRDILPDLPGLKERWGISVLHCPYCHGYELDQRPVGVLASGPMSFHQAMLVPDWGPTTLFTQGLFEPDTAQRSALQSRHVAIETEAIVELRGSRSELDSVVLADGRTRPISGLFLAPKTVPASDLAEQLGCTFVEGTTGPIIKVDDWQRTSVPGICAAGDAANPMANATIAAATGVMAAGATHQSLIFPDIARIDQ